MLSNIVFVLKTLFIIMEYYLLYLINYDEKLRFEFTTTSKAAQERLGVKK